MRLQGVLGIIVFLTIAWCISEKRKSVRAGTILTGVIVQFAIAAILLYVPFFQKSLFAAEQCRSCVGFGDASGHVVCLRLCGRRAASVHDAGPWRELHSRFPVAASGAGDRRDFVVALLLEDSSVRRPRTFTDPAKSHEHWRRAGTGASATVFLGMVEAPLVIKPYLKNMTRSELFSMMTVGMACIAGTVMILYATILNGVIPDPLGHILVASLIHVAAAITIARIMVPETGEETAGSLIPRAHGDELDGRHRPRNERRAGSAAEHRGNVAGYGGARSTGQCAGGLLPNVQGQPLTLQRLLGFIMSPVVWLFGIPWSQAQTAGSLMGTKTILNEFLAFLDLAKLPQGALDPRSRLIMTYALTSFANFGSLGILIGGLGSLAPERRNEVVNLGMRAVVAGTLATCMTGAVVGILA